jgi:hypothetical protein
MGSELISFDSLIMPELENGLVRGIPVGRTMEEVENLNKDLESKLR